MTCLHDVSAECGSDGMTMPNRVMERACGAVVAMAVELLVRPSMARVVLQVTGMTLTSHILAAPVHIVDGLGAWPQ